MLKTTGGQQLEIAQVKDLVQLNIIGISWSYNIIQLNYVEDNCRQLEKAQVRRVKDPIQLNYIAISWNNSIIHVEFN